MAIQATTTPPSAKAQRDSRRLDAEKAPPELISGSVTLVERPRGEPMSDEQRREMIAVAAYYVAERRAFVAGHEEEDWLAAEAQLDVATSPTSQRPA